MSVVKFIVRDGKAIPTSEPTMKVCDICGKSFPLNPRHFRRRTNSSGVNKGWHPECHTCHANEWKKQL